MRAAVIIVLVLIAACKQEPATIWPEGRIPYQVYGFNETDYAVLVSAMSIWEAASQGRVHFFNADLFGDKKSDDDIKPLQIVRVPDDAGILGATFFRGYDCNHTNYALISYVDQRTCLHELGHVLGLIDEHCRPDRDYYITINWTAFDAAVGADLRKNWGLQIPEDYKFYEYPYDYASVMHEGYAEDSEGNPVIDAHGHELGGSWPTALDAGKVFDIYSPSRDR